jgi:transcriptional regulator of acetoin/glycerol metabolism
LYYRLCADRIATPTLRERIEAEPNELELMVTVLSERIAGPEHGAALAGEVLDWIARELGRDYGWPGNVRELELSSACAMSWCASATARPAARRESPPSTAL